MTDKQQALIHPIIYNAVNSAIIEEMKKADLYDIFIAQIGRVQPGPCQIFVFVDSTSARLIYYMLHRGFMLESDNGFSSITIQNPAACPDLCASIDTFVRECFDSAITALWVDNPSR